MILLLGATGFVGQAFVRELRTRGVSFVPLSREAFDYTRFEFLSNYIRRLRPELVINAAGSTGRPNIDACEMNRVATFAANVLLPQKVARICASHHIPLGHVSSGGIYTGAKVLENGLATLQKDLNTPNLRRLFETQPEKFSGFNEWDPPNHTFRSPPCSFFAGTKALAEELLRGYAESYIWRIRMPFNNVHVPCNFLSRLQHYTKVYDHLTSLSHLDDFARACLDLYELR